MDSDQIIDQFCKLLKRKDEPIPRVLKRLKYNGFDYLIDEEQKQITLNYEQKPNLAEYQSICYYMHHLKVVRASHPNF